MSQQEVHESDVITFICVLLHDILLYILTTIGGTQGLR
jgi:hypothetical protein